MLIVLGICAVIVIAALAISLFLPGGEGGTESSPTPPADTAQGGVPGAEPSPEPTPEPTSEPTPSPTPVPEPEL